MTVSTPRWLLDTNIISALMRNPSGEVAANMTTALRGFEGARICTSVIVDCELQFGLQKSQSARYRQAYEVTMGAIETLPLEGQVARQYASIRDYLQQRGTPIGPNDMLIAAHALALDCTLVTDNEEEFRRVPGLRVENWLRADNQSGT